MIFDRFVVPFFLEESFETVFAATAIKKVAAFLRVDTDQFILIRLIKTALARRIILVNDGVLGTTKRFISFAFGVGVTNYGAFVCALEHEEPFPCVPRGLQTKPVLFTICDISSLLVIADEHTVNRHL